MAVSRMSDGKRWKVTLRYKDYTGRIRQHKKEGFAKKSDAKEYERDFLQRVNGSPGMTIKALYTLYMEDCTHRLKPSTIHNKRNMFEIHILPELSGCRVSEITPASVRLWQNTMLKKGLKPSTLKIINAQLSALLNFAVKFYGLQTNPCKLAGSIGSLKTEEMRILTPAQFAAVLNAMEDNIAQTLFHLLFWTGMRVGEAQALTPSDFDFSAPSVRITKTYRMINGNHIISTPKTEKSNRTVILTDETSDRMQAYISKLFGCSSRTRIFGSHSLSWYRKRLIDGCLAAQLEPIRIHDLRHSHASLMIEIGVSPLLIAERLGHESVETTLRTYSHLYPNRQRDFIERLNRLDFTL